VTIRSGVTRMVGTYPELLLVLVAAVVGLGVGRPLRWAGGHQGINILLAVLVFATAITVSTDSLRRLTSSWKQLGAALALGITVLPAISWLASRIVAIGVAPCEIASVATTALAGGEAALAAAVLIGSTTLSVALAGVILSLEANQSHVHPLHILVNLCVVVALPLVVGLLVSAKAPLSRAGEANATKVATAALVGLVALVAAQVHIGVAYVAVLIAIVIIVAVSAVLGSALGRTTTKSQATPLLLTISMRDFAIAAGLATAAFGPSAAAPLGLYGVVVIVWGTAVAGRLRIRPTTISEGL
jgi:predicted Na+-dependent transporter